MASKNELIVTAIQPLIKMNAFEYNLDHYRQLFDEFSTVIQGSNVLCFPEYWNGIRKDQLTEIIQKKSSDFLKKTAISLSTWVVGGSHLVRDGEKIVNRSHIFNPIGQLIGVYDKRNLFGYERFQEITPGKNDFFWEINDWKATVKLCSDLWNTNEFSSLISKNIELVFSPALTTIPNASYTNYGRFMWHNLAVIRAKEAAAAVIVSDTGKKPIREPYWSAGASCIVDPSWRFTNQEPIGEKILSVIPEGDRGIVSTTLDIVKIHKQKKYRREMGLLPEL